ncbi:LPS export ABC transporter permease LptG [Solimonas marina]|uniref:LPS export ABC transporter permease LptG n=1 Tax=Solimonas marina TaxID=2714601 RepID=A0A969WAC7_9GAMM|nr:LPS export ABC transporter permease LptG [Solimonas marina]NKF23292.1 LPS export ABC transporter permease LptG [Solimonas marina]
MKRLARHLVAHIAGFSTIVGLALVAIYTFVTFVSEIDKTGEGDFGVLQLLYYTLMLMPTALYTLMPVIALLGTLMGLGTLAAQNEITAMRASGMTVVQLGAATLIAGVLLGGLEVVLGDVFAPIGTETARSFRSESQNGTDAGVAARPLWLRDGSAVVHIGTLKAEDRIADVDLYELGDDLSLQSALHAQNGEYVDGHWHLTQIKRTRFRDGRAESDTLPAMDVGGRLTPDVLRLFVLEADSLTTPGLIRLIAYLDRNGLDASSYRLSLWRKLVAPLTVMAMMLFAVPFILGSQRGGGAGQRLLVGIIVGLVFYVINEVTASMGQIYGWPPFLAAGLPTAALAGLALMRLRRAS